MSLYPGNRQKVEQLAAELSWSYDETLNWAAYLGILAAAAALQAPNPHRAHIDPLGQDGLYAAACPCGFRGPVEPEEEARKTADVHLAGVQQRRTET